MTARDREFVERLLANDAAAWEHLTVAVAAGIMRGKHQVEWLARTGHTVSEVASELYVMLCEDDFRRVRNIRSSVVSWLSRYVDVAVRTVIDPKRRRGGGKEFPEVLVPGGGSDEESDEAMSSIDEMSVEAVSDLRSSEYGQAADIQLEDQEEDREKENRKREVRKAFRAFWKQQPRVAYALQMYVQHGLSYAEIGRLMGEKGNTVQQWIYRSRDWWVEKLAEISPPGVTNPGVDFLSRC